MDHIEHPDEAKYFKNNQYIYYIYHLIGYGNEVEIMTKVATNISLTMFFGSLYCEQHSSFPVNLEKFLRK